MKTTKVLFTLLAVLLLSVSCEKDEPQLTNLAGTEWEVSQKVNTNPETGTEVMFDGLLSFYESTAILRISISDGKEKMEVTENYSYTYDSEEKKGVLSKYDQDDTLFTIDGDIMAITRPLDTPLLMKRKK